MNLSNLRFDARHITICSVFPMECREMRDYGVTPVGGRTEYIMPAAEKGSYRTLKVFDSFQRTQDKDQCEATGRPSFMPFIVTAESLAHDLIRHWVEARIGGASGFRPGIGIIAGDEPTKEEIATLEAQQAGYFEYLFHDAQKYAQDHQWKAITDLHRAAARWLGLKAPWVAQIGNAQMKECVACREPIHQLATKCKVCMTEQPSMESDMEPAKQSVKTAPKITIAPPLKPPAGHHASL